jgi:DnaJ-class molecular chaperone
MSKNLVELMADAVKKSLWSTTPHQKAEIMLSVVKEHIGLVAERCKKCLGSGREHDGWTNGYNFAPVIEKTKECSVCKGYGVIARTEGDV